MGVAGRFIVGLACAAALAAGVAAERSKAVRAEFQRSHPCPATGAPRGACPGFEVDHVVPLCAGGPDATSNMQWLTHEEHSRKTKRDVLHCRLTRKEAR